MLEGYGNSQGMLMVWIIAMILSVLSASAHAMRMQEEEKEQKEQKSECQTISSGAPSHQKESWKKDMVGGKDTFISSIQEELEENFSSQKNDDHGEKKKQRTEKKLHTIIIENEHDAIPENNEGIHYTPKIRTFQKPQTIMPSDTRVQVQSISKETPIASFPQIHDGGISAMRERLTKMISEENFENRKNSEIGENTGRRPTVSFSLPQKNTNSNANANADSNTNAVQIGAVKISQPESIHESEIPTAIREFFKKPSQLGILKRPSLLDAPFQAQSQAQSHPMVFNNPETNRVSNEDNGSKINPNLSSLKDRSSLKDKSSSSKDKKSLAQNSSKSQSFYTKSVIDALAPPNNQQQQQQQQQQGIKTSQLPVLSRFQYKASHALSDEFRKKVRIKPSFPREDIIEHSYKEDHLSDSQEAHDFHENHGNHGPPGKKVVSLQQEDLAKMLNHLRERNTYLKELREQDRQREAFFSSKNMQLDPIQPQRASLKPSANIQSHILSHLQKKVEMEAEGQPQKVEKMEEEHVIYKKQQKPISMEDVIPMDPLQLEASNKSPFTQTHKVPSQQMALSSLQNVSFSKKYQGSSYGRYKGNHGLHSFCYKQSRQQQGINESESKGLERENFGISNLIFAPSSQLNQVFQEDPQRDERKGREVLKKAPQKENLSIEKVWFKLVSKTLALLNVFCTEREPVGFLPLSFEDNVSHSQAGIGYPWVTMLMQSRNTGIVYGQSFFLDSMACFEDDGFCYHKDKDYLGNQCRDCWRKRWIKWPTLPAENALRSLLGIFTHPKGPYILRHGIWSSVDQPEELFVQVEEIGMFHAGCWSACLRRCMPSLWYDPERFQEKVQAISQEFDRVVFRGKKSFTPLPK